MNIVNIFVPVLFLVVCYSSDPPPPPPFSLSLSLSLHPIHPHHCQLHCYHCSLSHWQVLYYSRGELRPRRQDNKYFISEDQLPHMVNPLESSLGKTINFLFIYQLLINWSFPLQPHSPPPPPPLSLSLSLSLYLSIYLCFSRPKNFSILC